MSLPSAFDWDIFLAHAREDKTRIVRPLALELQAAGVAVWFDEFAVEPGDSVTGAIDVGLARSRYAALILSKHFFAKTWPMWEYHGLVAREQRQGKVIIPVWVDVDQDEVLKHSPALADRSAIAFDGSDVHRVATELLRVIDPLKHYKHSMSFALNHALAARIGAIRRVTEQSFVVERSYWQVLAQTPNNKAAITPAACFLVFRVDFEAGTLDQQWWQAFHAEAIKHSPGKWSLREYVTIILTDAKLENTASERHWGAEQRRCAIDRRISVIDLRNPVSGYFEHRTIIADGIDPTLPNLDQLAGLIRGYVREAADWYDSTDW